MAQINYREHLGEIDFHQPKHGDGIILPIKRRGEVLCPANKVILTVQFKDQYGKPINADTFPTISITQPSGLVALSPTSRGVEQIGCGNYSYLYTIGIDGPLGVYEDRWVASINGFRIESAFQFIVIQTEVPAIPASDEFAHLGDPVNLNYSQCAIHNINKLLRSLKARMNSSGKAKSHDAYGNITYIDCDIFSIDQLTTFLATSLWNFNQIPFFTFFKFEDDGFVDQFGEILVEGATLYALASIALLERGREFQLTDNGINFNPPTMSELLEGQYSTLLISYNENLKYIKNSLRPHPLGLGIFSMTSGYNPALHNMRLTRERRVF